MNVSQSEQDDFENGLFYFVDALKILEMNAEAQCEHVGNYNVPWELQHDVSESGVALVRSSASYLSHEQADKVIELSLALNSLPQEAVAPPGVLTSDHAGSLMAMNHAAWAPLRQKAAQLLLLLGSAIQKNESYFGQK
jgi:hypothetical protein